MANRRNLEKKWDSLFRRADIRSRGSSPPRRGKKGNARRLEERTREEDEANANLARKNHLGRLELVTQFVDTDTNLPKLISKRFDDSSGNSKESSPSSAASLFGLIGLHTCGNLAADSIKEPYLTILG